MKSLWIGFLRWFDNGQVGAELDEGTNPDAIDWVRVIPFLGMHLMVLGVFWVGWSWPAVTLCLALYFIRMFAVTGFYHRYFSHRTFQTTRFWQFIMAVWGSSATQKGPLWWAAHHRHHHRHSDDEEDPHSPHSHSLFHSHVGWITIRRYFPTNLKAVPDLAKYPELRFLDRFYVLVPVLLGAACFFFGKAWAYWFPESGVTAMQMLVWGFFVSTVLLFHCTCLINSAAHLMGKKRFETGDQSRNSLILALITLGEGWHNNHHYYPGAVRQGFYWWEIDITYYGLRMLQGLGLIWKLNAVPQTVVDLGRTRKAAGKPVAERAVEMVEDALPNVADLEAAAKAVTRKTATG